MMTRRILGLGALGTSRPPWDCLACSDSSSAAEAKTYKVSYTDAEWRQRLTPEQYRILRNHGTERAGTSVLNGEKGKGAYACAGCDQALFRSETKFESAPGGQASSSPSTVRSAPHGQRSVHDADRSALRPLWRPSRSRVRRWPPAHRLALLHEWRGHDIPGGRPRFDEPLRAKIP